MKKYSSLFLLIISNVMSFRAFAQNPAMADKLREDGKIWVVVAVILVVLAGVLWYLVNLDKKISKIEKSLKG